MDWLVRLYSYSIEYALPSFHFVEVRDRLTLYSKEVPKRALSISLSSEDVEISKAQPGQDEATGRRCTRLRHIL